MTDIIIHRRPVEQRVLRARSVAVAGARQEGNQLALAQTFQARVEILDRKIVVLFAQRREEIGQRAARAEADLLTLLKKAERRLRPRHRRRRRFGAVGFEPIDRFDDAIGKLVEPLLQARTPRLD